MMKILFRTFLVCVCLGKLYAQEGLPVNLQQVLELAGANNLTIKALVAQQKISQARLKEANEWWYPTLYLGANTNQLWGTSMNADGTFNTDVSSDNLWLGMGVSVTLNFADGIYKTKAAERRMQASEHLTQAQKNQMLLQCIYAYYDLLNEQMKIRAFADLVAQSETITHQIAVQVEAGLRYESELQLAKSNLAHYKLEAMNATKAYRLKSIQLVRLLNLGQDVMLVSSEAAITPIEFKTVQSLDNDRSEIKAVQSSIQALQEEKKAVTTGHYMPQLQVNGYGSEFGSLSGDIETRQGIQDTQQLYPTTGANVGLVWKVPLGRVFSQGEKERYDATIKAQYLQEEDLEAQIQEEIKSALAQLQIGKEQIIFAKQALQTTTKALNQSIQRQKLGTAKPFEVFQVQAYYLQAKIDYFKTISEYNKAQFSLKVAKGEVL